MHDLISARAVAYDMVYNGVEVSHRGALPALYRSTLCLSCDSSGCDFGGTGVNRGASLKTASQSACLWSLTASVCGWQIGGGSLRIFRRDIQEQVFKIIGLTPKEASSTPVHLPLHLFAAHCQIRVPAVRTNLCVAQVSKNVSKRLASILPELFMSRGSRAHVCL